MFAEGYDLSVQCDSKTHKRDGLTNYLPVRDSFTGPNRRYCWAQAKKAGWLLNGATNGALCRQCARRPGQPE